MQLQRIGLVTVIYEGALKGCSVRAVCTLLIPTALIPLGGCSLRQSSVVVVISLFLQWILDSEGALKLEV